MIVSIPKQAHIYKSVDDVFKQINAKYSKAGRKARIKRMVLDKPYSHPLPNDVTESRSKDEIKDYYDCFNYEFG